MPSELHHLIDLLDRTHAGDAWHGPSVMHALDGVTPEVARARPIAGAHSIWEIVLHVTGWRREVRRRLDGGTPALPEDGDWPDQPASATDDAWSAVLRALEDSHDALVASVRAFDERRLDTPVDIERSRELGTGVPWYVMLHGIVQHDLYHAGQIALLRKASM